MKKGDPFKKLKRKIGVDKVLDRKEDLMVYAVDASYTTPPGNHDPDVVVLAETAEDVIQTVLFARETGFHIIPRGAGTGMSAGAVPLGGGIVISTEAMQKIIELNVNERWIQCQMGLTTAKIKEAAASHKLMYPPDPSSYKISSIGGNIAENAGGLRCVKYGTTKDYVMGLRYVDAEGDVVSTGVLQETPGSFDLTPLLVGSEGLFGVIVEARLALIPAPKTTFTILAHFSEMSAALEAIHTFLPELSPSVCELMDHHVIEAIRQFDPYPFPSGTRAAMLVETDGDFDLAKREADRVAEVLQEKGALELHQTQDATVRERLWNLRRLVSPALSRIADGKMNEDVVVPITRMGELIQCVWEIAEKYEVKIPIYGHAGDGNLHLNVMYNTKNLTMTHIAHDALLECFKVVIDLGGVISGEHGIGAAKNRYMNLQYNTEQLRLLKSIKDAFDPTGLFNPYKFFPTTMR